MARPKKNLEEKIGGDYLDASYILNKPKKIVKTTPALDIALNGGIPEGVICIFESEPKVGKTTLALNVGANGQQEFDKVVIYVSVENRLSIKNLKGVDGLDLSPEKFKIIASTDNNILTTEEVFERAENAIADFPGSIVILDSISALSSNDEQTKKYGEGYGGIDSRKLEGQFMRRISGKILINDNIVIGIAHLTQNIGGRGSNTKVADATLYAHDVRLRLKKHFEKSNPGGEWTSGDKIIGQKVRVNCLTSALGAPGGECVCWLRYGHGYSKYAEVGQLAIDLSLVEKKAAGGWISSEQYGFKVQGMDEFSQYLEENKEVYNGLYKQVQEMFFEENL